MVQKMVLMKILSELIGYPNPLKVTQRVKVERVIESYFNLFRLEIYMVIVLLALNLNSDRCNVTYLQNNDRLYAYI